MCLHFIDITSERSKYQAECNIFKVTCQFSNFALSYFTQEHWNYFGADENLGPVAVSIRREKPEETKENGSPYNYRIIFRTSEVSRKPERPRLDRSEESRQHSRGRYQHSAAWVSESAEAPFICSAGDGGAHHGWI